MKKLLIISDIWPCESLTAGIALSKLIKSISRSIEVSTFVTINSSLKTTRPTFPPSAHNFYTFKPNEDWKGTFFLKFFLNRLITRCTFRDIDRITFALDEIIDKINPDHVLLVLQGQTTYLLSKHIISLGLPYSTLTWDPWDWWASTHGVGRDLDTLVKEIGAEVYAQGMHLVPTLKFADENFIEESRAKVIYFPEVAQEYSEVKKISSAKIKIVFSGANYSSRELLLFINCLRSVNWTLNGKEVFFHIVGALSPVKDRNIIEHGWIDNSMLPGFLTNFDIAFLPYPTDLHLLPVSEQSFPSKLSGYLSASLPVIYLGPSSASVLKVLPNVIFELIYDGEKIINLEQTVRDIDSSYLDLAKNAHSIYTSLFSYEAFEKNLLSWGASVDLLEESGRQSDSKPHEYSNSSYKYVGPKFKESILLHRLQLIFTRALVSKVWIFTRVFVSQVRTLLNKSLVSIGSLVANVYVSIFKFKNFRNLGDKI